MKRFRRAVWAALILPVALAAGCKGDPAASARPAIPEPARLPAVGPGVHQQTASVPGGDTLRYTISVPPGYSADKPAPAWSGRRPFTSSTRSKTRACRSGRPASTSSSSRRRGPASS